MRWPFAVLLLSLIVASLSSTGLGQGVDELPPTPPRTYAPEWSPPQYASLPWVKVDGTHFCFDNGTYVVFHGLDYMGLELHPAFYNQSLEDFDIMASWGFNLVRLPIDWSWVEPEPGVYNQSYIDQIRRVISMANRYGIYVVIDMHQLHWSPVFYVWGGDNGLCGDGLPSWAVPYQAQTKAAEEKDKAYFWSNATVEEEFASMWGYVASQFANDSGVLGYDLFNEPTTPTNWTDQEMYQNMARVYDMAISAIRKVDTRHVIFFESTDYDSAGDVGLMPEPYDPYHELALEVHDYYTTFVSNAVEGPFKPSGGLAAAISASEEWGIPLWAGEFGDDPNYQLVRMPVTAFDSYGLSWCYWTYFWAWWQGYTFDGAGDLRPEVPALIEPYVRLSSVPVSSLVEKTLSNGSIDVHVAFANATSGQNWAQFFIPYGYSINGLDETSRTVEVRFVGNALDVTVNEVPVVTGHPVDFNEIGLPEGANWSVTLGKLTQRQVVTSTTGTLSFLEPPGTYLFNVTSPGYYYTPASGVIKLGEGPVIVDVSFFPPPSLDLNASSPTVALSRSIRLKAKVVFANGHPLVGLNVSFYSDGRLIGVNGTGEDGVATLSYAPRTEGEHEVVAVASGYPWIRSNEITVMASPAAASPPWSESLVVGAIVLVGAALGLYVALRRNGRRKRRERVTLPFFSSSRAVLRQETDKD